MISRPWRWGAGAVIAGIALLVACDGENLFDPNQNPFLEPRVSVSAPDGAFAGDTMAISVSATAASDVATIAVSVRGAATKDTTIEVVAARSVSAIVKVALPTILTDTLIYVAAVATDVNGNVSKVKADTVSVLGPPAVISVTGPDSLQLGSTATISIRAFGSRRIAQFDLALRGAISRDTTIVVVPPANDVTQSVSISIPATVADTALRVGIVVKDVTGLSSAPVSFLVPLAISPPVASLTAPVPTTVSPGAMLDLSLRATAMRGVSRIGVVLSGAMSKDTSIVVEGTQTDVTLPMSIRVPGDITGTTITVTPYAIDKAGQRSVPGTATNVTVNTGLPVIVSVTGPDSTRAGQIVDIRVVAQGVRPITELNIRFRGAVSADQRVVIIPAATSVTKDVQIQLPIDVSDTILTVTAVATDQAGQLSALTTASTKTVRVTDVTAPTVSATATPGATSAGSIIAIRVNARDNVGLRQVGYAVVNPAGDTIGTTPTLATTSGAVKDTTFSFTVPLTITPRTVRVLGIAVDASGRRGYSTAASVTVADSAAPAITLNAPTASSTLPLNDSVRVNVRVVDASGIKSIVLYGQSVRIDSLGPTVTIQRFAQKTITFPATPGTAMPTDTTVTRYLLAIPDSISETVSIIVEATDSLGNKAVASTNILVGGPRVEMRNPLTNSQVVPGGTLSLQAFALDRSSGIDSVQISLTGVQTFSYKYTPGCLPAVCAPNGLTSTDSVVVSQDHVVPLATPNGTLTITATAWNRNRVAGQSTPVNVLVSTTAVSDTSKPQVKVAITANDRVELSDTITVNVAAQDVGSNGIRRMGIVVSTTPGGGVAALPDFYMDTLFGGSGRTGLQPKAFKFTLADLGYTELNLQRLPRTITFAIHAFALDAGGYCGANVNNTLAALECTAAIPVIPAPTVSGETDYYKANNATPLSLLVTVVPGRSVPLPRAGSHIADVVVDNNPARPRLFLSNFSLNRLDVLDLTTNTYDSVAVGSEPWGMFLANAPGGDGLLGTSDDNPTRLIVGNSGGTNLSFVNLNTLTEEPAERLLTPNALLFDVRKEITNTSVNYLITYHDFSDRPQFVAEDANGIYLYSTKPTGAAPDGTVRYLAPTGGPRSYESKIIYTRDAVSPINDNWAIANIDSITGGITLWDHVPGNPGLVYSATDPDINVAINNLKNGPTVGASLVGGSDIDAYPSGMWNLDVVGLSDTTFVTTSGDRKFVAFGEGATGPFASVWLWRAGAGPGLPGTLSDNLTVQDLIGNAAERVLGIGLNYNGTIGAARGSASAYFFSNNVTLEGDLRLQGLFGNGVAGGNGGIALHPSHTYDLVSGSNPFTLGFVATVNRSIKIVDTFSFIERGEIQIRDNIVGPLRAALPIGGITGPFNAGDENFGVAPDPLTGTADCNVIWAKLYGVTGAGNAVIINVRKKDIVNPTITAGACSQ